MTSGPTFGSASINVVVQNIQQLEGDRTDLIPTFPAWVIAGVSVSHILDEVDVSPALWVDEGVVLIHITPKEGTRAGVAYQVIALIGDEVHGPEIVKWNPNQIRRKSSKTIEFKATITPPTRIVVNVIRGGNNE